MPRQFPPKISRICIECGTVFLAYPYVVKQGFGKYCNRVCQNRAQTRNRWSNRRSLTERFWMNVQKTNNCWLWTGKRMKSGYGFIGKNLTHRLSWIIHNGNIPDNLYVLHHCDNPPCINPSHLFLGTNEDNMLDKNAKGRTPHGEGHHAAIFTDDDIREILHRAANGETHQSLANEFHSSRGTISKIVRRERWKHIV